MSTRFSDELMALGYIAGHKLVRVVGSGSYGVAIHALSVRESGAAPKRPRSEADAAGPSDASPPSPGVVIKVAKRPLGSGVDSVWAAHSGEWAALVAVEAVPGAPAALTAGVLSLPAHADPTPPAPSGHPLPPGAHVFPHRAHAFMTMARLGPDLWNVMGRAGGPSAWRAAVFAPLAEAMLAAVAVPHAAGLVHRDVKPENMCLGKAGGAGGAAEAGQRRPKQGAAHSARVVLIDYGGAVVPGRRIRSRDRLFYGTPMYASLASLRGCPPKPWDDLEALGYCFAELWLGTLPWGGEFHSLVDHAPGGKWSIASLEAMADAKQADWEATVAAGGIPWFLTAWMEAVGAGRAAADAAEATAAVQEPAADPPVHPAHPAPCLRVFTSLVRAGVCMAEAGREIAKMGAEVEAGVQKMGGLRMEE